MREILFRGKRVDNGEWVYGSYQPPVEWGGRTWDVSIASVTEYGWLEDIPVIPETVGQFTGQTDKNGKKIFEGDIIKTDNGKQSAVSIVKFGEHYPKMFYKMLDMLCPGRRHLPANGFYAESVDKHEEMILFQSPCVEIIGNIHDNQELSGDSK